MVIIVIGLPGSGKSYFASRLSEVLNAVYFSSDQFRKKNFSGMKYSMNEKLIVYEKLLSETLKNINNGKNVVLDGTFYKQSIREQFISALLEINQKIIFIEIRAEPELIQERLKGLRKDSDADYQVYQKLITEYEPLTESHLTLFSRNDNIEYMLQEALEHIANNS
ncbi:MAG TPA: AAA family ATPase [Cytophagaceae bacterium]|jgi:predicted kinase|nr:AAA family ATPase [Cytophagaceae bacterium]